MSPDHCPAPPSARAERIDLFDVHTPPMRAFHMSWIAFFLCFFAWFGIAPLMGVVRDELSLTRDQVGWCIIGSVVVTVFVRLAVGRLCDAIGPRRAYTGLLMLGALPVMGIALANDAATFLIFRVLIGAIGASFVITQYHTTLMFAPNCVGTANATTAGWGNLGGGVTQLAMPALFAACVGILGLSDAISWRLCMVAAGVLLLLMGLAYFAFTQDTPDGDLCDLRERGLLARPDGGASFLEAARDTRVWALFVLYGACFGIELTMNNIAAMYFADSFGMSMTTAGIAAASFGLMNLFARTLGGLFGDRFGARYGLPGRVRWLFACVLLEGLLLMVFSQMSLLILALPALIAFSLFVQMAEGATFSVVPFINRRALGSVAGIVGAGGNAGAVAAGFLFKGDADWSTSLLILGTAVSLSSVAALTIRFAPETADTTATLDLGELAPATT